MDVELAGIAKRLQGAEHPEDIFGISADGVDKAFRRLARIAHPDRYTKSEDKDMATPAFARLGDLYMAAKAKIADGSYGDKTKAAKIATDNKVRVRGAGRTYIIDGAPMDGDIAKVYGCSFEYEGESAARGVFKVPRHHKDNDLMVNEAAALGRLAADKRYDEYKFFVPDLVESLRYKDAASPALRQVNVLRTVRNVYTLEEVMMAYPKGIHPKDMAWMFRRLLAVIGFASRAGLTHGAVLPCHILIQPEDHGLVLIDWCASVGHESKKAIPFIAPRYKAWYPQEVMDKGVPAAGTDIYMAAQCMRAALGGDVEKRTMPAQAPHQIDYFLRGLTQPALNARPKDAWRVLKGGARGFDGFDTLLESLWGPKAFHPFTMPVPAAS